MTFDPANGIRLYAKKTGNNKSDWRIAAAENTKILTSEQIESLKFVQVKALKEMAKSYPPDTMWYLTVTDFGNTVDNGDIKTTEYSERTAKEEIENMLNFIRLQPENKENKGETK